ncbi:MAG TPA: cytochrome c oxidase assembly protein [Gaiellaceae bacterium]|nr:cytochrome c oxidase assembly protein [Gaiellaceae bacterium]
MILAHAGEHAGSIASAWEAPPAVLAGAVLALVLFAQAFVRLRQRGRRDHAGWGRAVLFVAGVVVGTLALVSPLDHVGEEYLLSAHMLQHVVIGDLAVALVIVAIRGPLTFFLIPQAALARLARLGWLRAFLRLLLVPWVALGLWAVTIAAWHVPAAYDYTLKHQVVHDLEHVSFVVVGALVWTQLVDPARRGELTRAGRIGLAVVLFAAGQILADVLIFSLRPLYGAYAAQPERLLGLSPLEDQRVAGLVMMGEQLLTLGTFVGLLLLAQHRRLFPRTGEERRAPA